MLREKSPKEASKTALLELGFLTEVMSGEVIISGKGELLNGPVKPQYSNSLSTNLSI